eukprot:Hpha_TRINITY_DN17163_c0_g1::TRINITY_DN17163_c0_g1_i1::g.146674::m.146674
MGTKTTIDAYHQNNQSICRTVVVVHLCWGECGSSGDADNKTLPSVGTDAPPPDAQRLAHHLEHPSRATLKLHQALTRVDAMHAPELRVNACCCTPTHAWPQTHVFAPARARRCRDAGSWTLWGGRTGGAHATTTTTALPTAGGVEHQGGVRAALDMTPSSPPFIDGDWAEAPALEKRLAGGRAGSGGEGDGGACLRHGGGCGQHKVSRLRALYDKLTALEDVPQMGGHPRTDSGVGVLPDVEPKKRVLQLVQVGELLRLPPPPPVPPVRRDGLPRGLLLNPHPHLGCPPSCKYDARGKHRVVSQGAIPLQAAEVPRGVHLPGLSLPGQRVHREGAGAAPTLAERRRESARVAQGETDPTASLEGVPPEGEAVRESIVSSVPPHKIGAHEAPLHGLFAQQPRQVLRALSMPCKDNRAAPTRPGGVVVGKVVGESATYVGVRGLELTPRGGTLGVRLETCLPVARCVQPSAAVERGRHGSHHVPGQLPLFVPIRTPPPGLHRGGVHEETVSLTRTHLGAVAPRGR